MYGEGLTVAIHRREIRCQSTRVLDAGVLDCREHRKIEEIRVGSLLVLDIERLTVVGIHRKGLRDRAPLTKGIDCRYTWHHHSNMILDLPQ